MIDKSKIPTGKVPFVWDILRAANAWKTDVSGLVDLLSNAGVNGVFLKLVEGRVSYNDPGVVDEFSSLLSAAGISLHGWAYNYGDTNPERVNYGQAAKEAELASEACSRWPVQSWTLNCEQPWKGEDGSPVPFQDQAAQLIVKHRNLLGDIPLGFTSYKYPNEHNLAWRVFLDGVDFFLPQVYWQGDDREDAGVVQLGRSLDEWYNKCSPVGEVRPSIPIGTIYKESNYPVYGKTWWPTPTQLANFLTEVTSDHYAPAVCGYSVWEVAEPAARPDLWYTFADFESVPPPIDPPIDPPVDPPDGDLWEELQEVKIRIAKLEEAIITISSGLIEVGAEAWEIISPTKEDDGYRVDKDVVMVKTTESRQKIYLSVITGLNDNKAPIMQLYPNDTSKVSERIYFAGGETIAVYKDSFVVDGGATYWRVVMDQEISLLPGSRPLSEPGKQLYLNNKFLEMY